MRQEDPKSLYQNYADIPLVGGTDVSVHDLVLSLTQGISASVKGSTNTLLTDETNTLLLERINERFPVGSPQYDELAARLNDFFKPVSTNVSTSTTTSTTDTTNNAIELPPFNAREVTLRASDVEDLKNGLVTLTASPLNADSGTTPRSIVMVDTSALPDAANLDVVGLDALVVFGKANINGGTQRSFVLGVDGSQVITMGGQNDVASGGPDNDSVDGGSGNDTVDGGYGEDLVLGALGNDTVTGGAGNDVLQGGLSDSGKWEFTVKDGRIAAWHQSALLGETSLQTVLVSDLNGSLAELGFINVPADARVLESVALLYDAAFAKAPVAADLSYWIQDDPSGASLADKLLPFLKTNGKLPAPDGFVKSLATQALGYDATNPADPNAAKVEQWIKAISPDDEQSYATVLTEIAQDPMHVRALETSRGIVISQDVHADQASWYARSGNDLLMGGPGNDSLVGGDGTDTARFNGDLENYQIKRGQADHWEVKDLRSTDQADGVDQILSIETLRFDDMTVDLTTVDAARALAPQRSDDLHDVVALYIGFYARLPDANDMRYWMQEMANRSSTDGAYVYSMDAIADDFYKVFSSSEFSKLSGVSSTMTDDQYVDYALKNVRGQDSGLRDPWLDMLKNGESRADVMLAMINDTQALSTADSAHRYLDRRITVGGEMSVDYGIGFTGSVEENYAYTKQLLQEVKPIGSTLALIGLPVTTFKSLGSDLPF